MDGLTKTIAALGLAAVFTGTLVAGRGVTRIGGDLAADYDNRENCWRKSQRRPKAECSDAEKDSEEKVWGNTRAILLGGVFAAVGILGLAGAAKMQPEPELKRFRLPQGIHARRR